MTPHFDCARRGCHETATVLVEVFARDRRCSRLVPYCATHAPAVKAYPARATRITRTAPIEASPAT